MIATRKGGGFYGSKVHAAVCTRTGLPLAWETHTAKDAEANFAVPLMESVIPCGFAPETCAADKGYDSGAIHAAFEDRDCRPVIPLRNDLAWSCPSPLTRPASIWIRASRKHPLVPRETKRWRDLYRGRAAVEREFRNLKHNHGPAVLHVRGLD
ncbi:MAG TPA: transposase, partial [Vicinamibacteria bacterium]